MPEHSVLRKLVMPTRGASILRAIQGRTRVTIPKLNRYLHRISLLTLMVASEYRQPFVGKFFQ